MESWEKFDYALRPAKSIERRMLADTFAHLSAIQPISDYSYIGFGSVSFLDFSLFHRRLGTTKMISIEKHEDSSSVQRFGFNKPIAGIDIRWGHSNSVLPKLDWKRRRAIVWLDYDTALDGAVFEDIQTVCSRIRSGSVFLLTVDARQLKLNRDLADIDEKRFDWLKQRVGGHRIPEGVTGGDLVEWKLATVYRQMIHDEIMEVLANRNAGKQARWQVEYQQLFNFHYADGAKMLTVGGILFHRDDKRRVAGLFDRLPFICSDETPYLIDVPTITRKEARHMEHLVLPSSRSSPKEPSWIPEKLRSAYAKTYRWFPNYVEAEL